MESYLTGGLFSTSEMREHINVLKLEEILFGLKDLGKGLTKVHIKVLTVSVAQADHKNVIL